MRTQFIETVIYKDVDGDMIPAAGVEITVNKVNGDGTSGGSATTYSARTGVGGGDTVTDAAGMLEIWLEPGDYDIHFVDPTVPPRIQSFTRAYTSMSAYDLALLQPLIGDQKFSMQAADHGARLDGTYEWLLLNGATDGTPRKVSKANYLALWAFLGSPAVDGSGNFALPHPSGRSIMAAGRVSGITGDAGGTTTFAVGAASGTRSHKLTWDESGTNGNGYTSATSTDHYHTWGAWTGGQNTNHLHGTDGASYAFAGVDGSLRSLDVYSNYIIGGHSLGMWANSSRPMTTTGYANVDHAHYVSGSTTWQSQTYNNANHQHGLVSRDADTYHNNQSPYVAYNFFIKT
jgi:microcystin-dependent protein